MTFWIRGSKLDCRSSIALSLLFLPFCWCTPRITRRRSGRIFIVKICSICLSLISLFTCIRTAIWLLIFGWDRLSWIIVTRLLLFLVCSRKYDWPRAGLLRIWSKWSALLVSGMPFCCTKRGRVGLGGYAVLHRVLRCRRRRVVRRWWVWGRLRSPSWTRESSRKTCFDNLFLYLSDWLRIKNRSRLLRSYFVEFGEWIFESE